MRTQKDDWSDMILWAVLMRLASDELMCTIMQHGERRSLYQIWSRCMSVEGVALVQIVSADMDASHVSSSARK